MTLSFLEYDLNSPVTFGAYAAADVQEVGCRQYWMVSIVAIARLQPSGNMLPSRLM